MFKKIVEGAKSIGKKLVHKANECKMQVAAVVTGAFAVAATTVTSFAAGTTVAIDSAMLEPILEGVAANVAVIVPVAIGLFVIVLGIGFIPKIFKKFSKG